jgi:endonuclease III related protein
VTPSSAAEVYANLLAAYGPQRWWLADEPFEIMAGALLVQRTTWRSAAVALDKLREQGLLRPEGLARASIAVVERCIRGAGFFRTKAARLRKLAGFVVEHGGAAGLARHETAALRSLLLACEGVGAETADVILLYAFDRAAIVVDGYLRRFCQRLVAAGSSPSDSRLRRWVADEIDDAPRLNEFHALVVAHGKKVCGARPLCPACGISRLCLTGRDTLREVRATSDT